jgi:hypothetical protein
MGQFVFATMVIAVIAIIAGTIKSIVNAVLSSKSSQWGKDGNQKVPPLFEKMFERAASERDEKIRKLEERIIVLEKIVTDNHGASKLADEIARLQS